MMKRAPSRSALLFALVACLVTAVFGSIFIDAALQPDSQAWVRGLTGRRPIDWQYAQVIFGTVGVAITLVSLFGLVAVIRRWSTYPRRSSIQLQSGETIRWSGRLGWASVSAQRWTIGLIIAFCPLPLLASLAWVASWQAPLLPSLLFGGAALMIFGPMAVVPIHHVFAVENRWLCELVGKLCVTDRRILWRLPGGAIADQLTRGDLVAVELVRSDGRKGWVELRERGDTHEAAHDLVGVPNPDAAIAAMRFLTY